MTTLLFFSVLVMDILVLCLYYRQNILIKSCRKSLRVLLKMLHTIDSNKEVEDGR
jgi:hypothetical protein